MSLPIYQHINVRSIQIEDLQNLLHKEINFKHPVALNLKHLDLEQQREIIGLIENYFSTNNLSFKFPYPVYLIMDYEQTITQMPSVKSPADLPKFFSQKDSKMNVKEAHLIAKNKLLQQEIHNVDNQNAIDNIKKFATFHRSIYESEKERLFYRSLLTKLVKANLHGK